MSYRMKGLALALILISVTVSSSAAQVTAIRAGKLLDPETGAVTTDQVIVVDKGIIKAVGNYGESFERNIGQGSPLKIARGLNALWTKGGLQYGLPVR